MTSETVKLDTIVMDRLRKYVAKESDGRMYGKISETIEEAITQYLDKKEKR